MLQTGTLYLPANNENAVEINRPLPNIFLYFSRNGDRVITTKTDEQGKFSFDLPLGSYQVTMSLGPSSQILPLCAGALFELKSNSAQNAFEKWVLSSIYIKPEENPFVIMLQEIAQQAKNSAVSAKASAESAEKTAKDFNENTVGSGKVMKEGAAGLASDILARTVPSLFGGNPIQGAGFYSWGSDSSAGYGSGVSWGNGNTFNQSLAIGLMSPDVYVQSKFIHDSGTVYDYLYTLLNSENTTVDSNGFVKRASPIISLYANYIEHNDQFDEEPIFEKLGVGHYKISNTLGLAKGLEVGDWYIETPKDKNGERYFNIEWEQLSDNTVIIRTYEREAFTEEYERYDENGEVLKDPNGNPLKFYKRHDINGEPLDITENRFISLRFYEEPKQHEAPEIAEESEEDRKAREEQQALEEREQEIADLKRNRTLKSNEALVMKDIDESVYLELIEEVKEINARLRSM